MRTCTFIIYLLVRGFQSVSYLCFVLTHFNISRSRSQLLSKINIWKDFANATKKTFVGVIFLTSCRSSLTTVLKHRVQYTCFSLIFLIFLGTVFYRTTVNSCFRLLSGVMEKYILEINNSSWESQSAVLLKFSDR